MLTKMVTRLCQLWIRRLIKTSDVFVDSASVAFSLYRLENSLNPKGYLSSQFWNTEIEEERNLISLLKTKTLMVKLFHDFLKCQ